MTSIAALNETRGTERRAALSPDAVKKYKALGLQVKLQSGAGLASGIADADYHAAGAEVLPDAAACLSDTRILLCVTAPPAAQLSLLAPESLLIGMLAPYQNRPLLSQLASQNVQAFAMELMPRISRAQAMDVLSSQANMAGYRAVIEAVAALPKATPMLMTAAGTVPPAKLLVLGAGVAGLQAIATAKRLGAAVSAFDVRPAVKEQVESLGAKFVEVPPDDGAAETAGGYAREMSEDYKRRQQALVHETVRKMDIVITTALIPGRQAPELITEAMVRDMKPGSVIVDMAVASGGNCRLSRPDEAVQAGGVTILGFTDLPSRVAVDTTPLYARNLYHFVATLVGKGGELAVNAEDELVKATRLTAGGAIIHPQFL